MTNRLKLTSQQKRKIKKILLVILGSVILGVGTGIFLNPYNIISGGVSGIAIIINHFTSLSTNMMIMALTWGFFLLGWVLLGNEFAAKTIVSAIVYPLASMLGSFLQENTMLNLQTIVNVDGVDLPTVNYLISALVGGVFVGSGCALTYLGGGSTGGVDVITLSVQKYTGIKASVPYLLIDTTIILLGLIFVNDFDVTLMGIMSSFVASFMVNKLFDTEKNVVVNIISQKYEELNQFILKKLNRGSTLVRGEGGYSQKDITILQVVCDIKEYYILEDIIAKVDPNAFVFSNRASYVRGEGFKSHEKPKLKLFSKKDNDTEENINKNDEER